MNDLIKGLNRVKRIVMVVIKKDYIKNKLKKRKGNCKRCGDCCRGCKYFQVDKCLVYDKRPWFCYKEFPLSRFDQKIFNVKNCGYKFE
jgi:hypothetical protein